VRKISRWHANSKDARAGLIHSRRLVIAVRTKFIEPRDMANSPVPLYHELKEPDVAPRGPKEAAEKGNKPARRGKGSA
jgi:hypothetical protein